MSGAAPATSGLDRMEEWISITLRMGVLLAAAIMAAGLGVFLFAEHQLGRQVAVRDTLGPDTRSLATSPEAILSGIRMGDAAAVIQLGVLILILTPVLRVALMLGFFVARRERLFAVISAIVLFNLGLGLVGRLP